jgi:hypothetical protein
MMDVEQIFGLFVITGTDNGGFGTERLQLYAIQRYARFVATGVVNGAGGV